MSSKITNFKDLQVEFPNRYEKTENGIKTDVLLDFKPGDVFQEGTFESAEVFNNINKNGLYNVAGTRTEENSVEIYDIDIDGIAGFDFDTLQILMLANIENTKSNSRIRLNNILYISNSKTGDIKGEVLITLNKSNLTATISNIDKLNKGNLPATIQTGERILELIENNSGLEFDENLLYIQDSGTKQANKYYFDKFQKGLFRCKTNTSTTVNSTNYFENESNRNNADRLGYLYNKYDASTGILNSTGVRLIDREGIYVSIYRVILVSTVHSGYQSQSYIGLIISGGYENDYRDIYRIGDIPFNNRYSLEFNPKTGHLRTKGSSDAFLYSLVTLGATPPWE